MENKFIIAPFFEALLTIIVIVGGSFLLFGPGPFQSPDSNLNVAELNLNSKIYVAIEGEGKISVIDPVGQKVVGNIDLSGFTPHNVQVSPNNKTVWVTGNAAAHAHSIRFVQPVNAQTDDHPDEVIVIDPVSDRVIKTIVIKPGIHLAHIVLTPDSKYAYVTAQTEGVIYKIDALSFKLVKSIKTGEDSQPHGLRISPDGKHAYVAMLGSKALGILNLSDDIFSEISLGGAAVQTGVTPDNKYAVVSLYDTKQLAVYDRVNKDVSYIELPASARGPIQMYSTPNSRFIYLADQGYYFEQPSSEWVYKIDIKEKKVVKEIKAGKAPHGVVVSSDGKLVYVTNLLSGDVSVIDTVKDEEIRKIKVGKEPNGISVWYKK